MKNKVIRLDELKHEFQASPGIEISEIHAGFSQRFNYFIDSSDLDAPSLNDGRIGYIAQILDVSRPAVTDWLVKNRPPKESTLFDVVSYLLMHIEHGSDVLPARAVAWLRYGNEVSPCPFETCYDSPDQKRLMPLAARIIANEAKSIGLGANSYDLEQVMPLTITTLVDFELNEMDQIKEIHLQIVRQHIRNHVR